MAVDAVAGLVLLRWIAGRQDSPTAAVTRAAALAAHGDWAGLHARLCRPDQARITPADLADTGRAALLTLRGLDRAEVTSVTDITLPVDLPVVGVVGLPARQVRGHLLASLGPPSDFAVVAVREAAGWRVCLSVGGYASSGLGVDVPVGG